MHAAQRIQAAQRGRQARLSLDLGIDLAGGNCWSGGFRV